MKVKPKNEYKNYLHYIDLLTRPLEWQKKGVNLILFDARTNSIICNPYHRNSSKIAIMIMFNQLKFVPIVNCKMIGKEIIVNGIFDINNCSFNEEDIKFYQKKNNTNVNLLKETTKRKDTILNLIGIHKNYCLNMQTKTINFIIDLDKFIDIDHKIIHNSVQVEYLLITNEEINKKNNKQLLIPIYPTNYFTINDSKNVIFLEENHYCNLDTYLELNYLYSKAQKAPEEIQQIISLFKEYDYKIVEILYNPVLKKVIGVKFKNNLVVPVIPVDINDKLRQTLSDDDDLSLESVLYDFNYSLNNEFLKITNKNLFMNDLLYNNFKFQFSKIIVLINNKKHYKKIK